MPRIIAIALGFLLLGCTPRYAEPPLSSASPDNPDAPAAPLPQRSRTLELPDEPNAGGTRAEPAPPPAPAAPEHPAPPLYACPMHPEITSDRPDQRCPRCGMKLTKTERAGGRP
jgi:hypothetical protein